MCVCVRLFPEDSGDEMSSDSLGLVHEEYSSGEEAQMQGLLMRENFMETEVNLSISLLEIYLYSCSARKRKKKVKQSGLQNCKAAAKQHFPNELRLCIHRALCVLH